MDKNYDFTFKIGLIGDSGVGKTSILQSFIDGIFIDEYIRTIGVEFKTKLLLIGDKRIKLQFWDAADPSKYGIDTKLYYKDTVGVLVVFDVTKPKSFVDIGQWIEKARENCQPDYIEIMLVANKCDLLSKRVVKYNDIKDFADASYINFIETSCKTNLNISELFTSLVTLIIRDGIYSPIENEIVEKPNSGIRRSRIDSLGQYEVLIIGDSTVGKTSLLYCFSDQQFHESYMSTIGVDFKEKVMTVDKTKVILRIWDTAGQERYHAITRRKASGIIIVYDVTSIESFENIKYWLNHVKNDADEGISIILVGNKCDCIDREVKYEDAELYANKLNLPYYETSAKENKNITEVFVHLTRLIINRRIDVTSQNSIYQQKNSLNLSQPTTKQKKKRCLIF